MPNTETLTSLAMLRVNSDEGQDYVEYLTPFISHVLSQARPDPVTDAGTQELLRSEFGLVLPKHAGTFALGRLARRKILKREHGVYHIIGSFRDGKLDQRRVPARRQQSVILNNLITFAKQEHNLEWTEQQAGDAVISSLSRFSVSCLKTFTQGCALPEPPERTFCMECCLRQDGKVVMTLPKVRGLSYTAVRNCGLDTQNLVVAAAVGI